MTTDFCFGCRAVFPLSYRITYTKQGQAGLGWGKAEPSSVYLSDWQPRWSSTNSVSSGTRAHAWTYSVGRHRRSTSGSLHFVFWRQGLWLDLDPTTHARQAGQQALGISPGLFTGAWDSGSHRKLFRPSNVSPLGSGFLSPHPYGKRGVLLCAPSASRLQCFRGAPSTSVLFTVSF